VPRVHYLSLFDEYLLGTAAFVFLVFIEGVALYFYYRDEEEFPDGRATEEWINKRVAVILVAAWLLWHIRIYCRLLSHWQKKRRWIRTCLGGEDNDDGQTELEMGSRKLKRKKQSTASVRRLSFKTLKRLGSRTDLLEEGSPGSPGTNLRTDRKMVTPSTFSPKTIEFKRRLLILPRRILRI
jgi:hypothetical protein